MDTIAINPYNPPFVGVCGRAVGASNFGSGGPGSKPRPSRCFLRQGTLLHFVCVFTQVYKWVPKTYSLRWTSMPSWPSRSGGEKVAILLGMLHAKQGVWYKLRPFGPGAHLYPFYLVLLFKPIHLLFNTRKHSTRTHHCCDIFLTCVTNTFP